MPAITLAEARVAVAGAVRREGTRDRGEEIVRRALEQREIVHQAKTSTKQARRDQQRTLEAKRQVDVGRRPDAARPEPDFDSPPPEYPVEIWDIDR